LYEFKELVSEFVGEGVTNAELVGLEPTSVSHIKTSQVTASSDKINPLRKNLVINYYNYNIRYSV